MSSSSVGPQSDHDWTIHSLNIHGIFFERWCQQIIDGQRNWKVTTTNYPVQVDGHQSNLDIRADLQLDERRLILLIECKKNNPEFVDWVFFLKPGDIGSGIVLPHIETDRAIRQSVRGTLQSKGIREHTMQFVNDARETRGNYQSHAQKSTKTNTSNAAVTEAAMQISLATQSVHTEEVSWAQNRLSRPSQSPPLPPLHPNTNIVPLIVTTARLFICGFNAHDVDGSTGEIPFSKTTLSPVPRVLYEFPLPHHLHVGNGTETEMGMRRHIIVVHSRNFADFLENHTLDLLPLERM